MRLTFVCWVLAASFAISSATERCTSLGFNADKLVCSTCELFVDSATLLEECKACCHVPTEDLYEHIVLEFDKRWMDYYDAIRTIAKEAKNKKDSGSIFQKVKIKTRFGARPTLHMYSAVGDDAPSDSISITNWSLDVIEDYIKSHLRVEKTVEV